MIKLDRQIIMQKTALMGELKSLLLTVDGSIYSEGAIKEAMLFAKSCGIKLTLLYVKGLSKGFESGGMTVFEKPDVKLEDYFDKIREDAAEENVELDIVIRHAEEPFSGIIEEAEERRADVIIMGRRGMTGLKRLMMGSVTAKVIAYAGCKVLVVPKDADVKGERIMLATDGSKCSKIAEIEAISMAKRCPHVKSFVAVSVAPSSDKLDGAKLILDRIKQTCAKESVAVETLALVGEPYKAIVNASLETNSDIVVMGTHGRTGLGRLIMGSVAERVVALSQCSTLVVKD
ncbi:universal stress protein [Candidatus Magnetoovum chiemensis]|nr:universal stress protein [Candidatus Magnetoovum chiemensis]